MAGGRFSFLNLKPSGEVLRTSPPAPFAMRLVEEDLEACGSAGR